MPTGPSRPSLRALQSPSVPRSSFALVLRLEPGELCALFLGDLGFECRVGLGAQLRVLLSEMLVRVLKLLQFVVLLPNELEWLCNNLLQLIDSREQHVGVLRWVSLLCAEAGQLGLLCGLGWRHGFVDGRKRCEPRSGLGHRHAVSLQDVHSLV